MRKRQRNHLLVFHVDIDLDSIYCVDIQRYSPDVVLIDFSVNDYGHPKLMEALLRKVLTMKSSPFVVLVNLWVHASCPTPRYLYHAMYYQVPIINICPAINLCFGRGRLPKWISDQYSKTDGVHPWGKRGVPFIGEVMYAWWKRFELIVQSESGTPSYEVTPAQGKYLTIPEEPIYNDKPVGACTRCDALVGDADANLEPQGTPIGFRVVTRVKVGYGGFNPEDRNSSTKSFKRCWQADEPGSKISFKFYGSSVRIAMWQRRDSMGVLHAIVDGNSNNIAKASGFFKGYTWAMEKNNTGRSEIVTLFEGLEDKEHLLTLTVSDEPANPWVKGHTAQIFALLSASDNPTCKSINL